MNEHLPAYRVAPHTHRARPPAHTRVYCCLYGMGLFSFCYGSIDAFYPPDRRWFHPATFVTFAVGCLTDLYYLDHLSQLLLRLNRYPGSTHVTPHTPRPLCHSSLVRLYAGVVTKRSAPQHICLRLLTLPHHIYPLYTRTDCAGAGPLHTPHLPLPTHTTFTCTAPASTGKFLLMPVWYCSLCPHHIPALPTPPTRHTWFSYLTTHTLHHPATDVPASCWTGPPPPVLPTIYGSVRDIVEKLPRALPT